VDDLALKTMIADDEDGSLPHKRENTADEGGEKHMELVFFLIANLVLDL